MKRILIVDDDVELCELLEEYLQAEGFGTDVVYDGKEGLKQALTGDYAIVVLDIMIPTISGFQVLQAIRSRSNIPVLMLTARGEDIDRIVGLEMGADDYLPKPFNPRELVARIRAILRRALPDSDAMAASMASEKTVLGDVEIDIGVRLAFRGGKRLELTTVEFNLLEVLFRNAGRVVSREELARGALGRSLGMYDRSVDVHISSLRRKLGQHPGGIERIRTVRGSGYLYALPYPPTDVGVVGK
ncbi:MAG: response regulator transcription factor [Syntrophobacteraceae bacterium]|nr:response regulator transcription factor [Desulfobacteraceae bacterium]